MHSPIQLGPGYFAKETRSVCDVPAPHLRAPSSTLRNERKTTQIVPNVGHDPLWICIGHSSSVHRLFLVLRTPPVSALRVPVA